MAQVQHIQLGLVIADEHRRPRAVQNLPALCIDIKPHPDEIPHRPFEGPSRRPLAEAAVAGEIQAGGGEGAVGGAEGEGEEGGERAAVEFELVDLGECGRDAERLREGEEDERGEEEAKENGVHFS